MNRFTIEQQQKRMADVLDAYLEEGFLTRKRRKELAEQHGCCIRTIGYDLARVKKRLSEEAQALDRELAITREDRRKEILSELDLVSSRLLEEQPRGWARDYLRALAQKAQLHGVAEPQQISVSVGPTPDEALERLRAIRERREELEALEGGEQ